jgi:hypothetical protein
MKQCLTRSLERTAVPLLRFMPGGSSDAPRALHCSCRRLSLSSVVGPNMSLSISVHLVNEVSGGIGTEIPLPSGEDLAGFEVWRREVYGSNAAMRLGLTLLPTLREDDIRVTGGDITKLKKEAECLIDHAEMLGSSTGVEATAIRFRAENIVHACDLALSRNAMVWIS